MATLVHIKTSGATESVPLAIDGARFVDADSVEINDEIATGGLFALPGLADCHTHLAQNSINDIDVTAGAIEENIVQNAWAQLEGGVLLCLDKGSRDDVSLRILEAPPERRPELQMAPRIIAAPGGYYQGFAVEVDDEGLADAVAAAAGPHGWIKIVGDWPRRGEGPRANFTETALRKAVGIAHDAGCRVAIHTMAPQAASIAVASGVDSIEHGLFMTEADIEALATRRGAWVPTIERVLTLITFLGRDSSGGKLLSAGLDNVRSLLPFATGLGVAVLAGSDLAVPHGRVAAEVLRLIEYGASVADAVSAASAAAYNYAGVDRGLTPGHRADAVFYAADPMDRPETLLEPAAVLRMGRWVKDIT